MKQGGLSLRDGQGRQYTLYPMTDKRLFVREFKSGDAEGGALVFEVPAGARDCVLRINAGKQGAPSANAEIPLP